MKQIFIVLIIILFIGFSLNSNAQSIERKVIASGGINYQSATLNVSSTIGETFITTIGNSGLLLTQGFQQPVPYSCPFVLNNGNDTIAACGTSYSLDAGAGYSSYSWSNGLTSQTATVTSTGWYKCMVTQGLCTASDSVFVSLVEGQILNNDTIICLGQSVALTLTGDNGEWMHIGNLPGGVCAAAGYIDNGKIWIHGGGNLTSVISQGMYFDLNTGTTGYASPIPFARVEPGFGRVGNKFYVIGGYTGSVASNNTQEYDLTSGVWSQKASMPTNRSVLSSAVLNNEIYVCGGWPGTQNTFEKYNPVLNSWTSLPPIPTARHSVNSATALNGKLYFLSGKNDLMTQFYNSNEAYDPVSNTWQTKAPVLYSVFGASATTLNNKIYLVGGSKGSYNQYENNTMEIFKYTQIYNPVSDSWSLGPELPYGTSLSQLLVDGGNLYLIGGLSKDSSNNINIVSSIYKLNTSLSYLWSNGATTSTISVTPSQTTIYYCTVSNGITSCTDSVTVTVNPTSTSSTTATACDSYQWNGNTYTTSGTYTYTTTNAVGCDSVATLNLTITPSTINTTSITSCGSYTWIVNGQTYAQSGTYSSLSNCHTEILNLTVLPVHSMPVLACYQTANFNNTTCTWDITGSQPAQPTLACYESANFNTTTCTWDVTGTQPAQPTLACWANAAFNNTTCTWDITGNQPAQPILACYETATFNTSTCVWDVTGAQPAAPTVACYETANFNAISCSWDVTGSQPLQPTLACYQSTTFNTTTCAWDVTGSQPALPTIACYDSTSFNSTTCSWEVTGSQPTQPTLACYESANFNSTTCTWDITGNQPAQPILACYETATFNNTTCVWDVTGTQPAAPSVACYESANFNSSTCAWDVTGSQPTQPTLACYESANFNATTCTWDITGSQPTQPTISCYESVSFNTTTCAWDITGSQPSQPSVACYETASFNTSSCAWDVTGSQPTSPTVACYESANFNTTTCTWDVTGSQPSQPTLACYETANFNTSTCAWDVTGSPAAQIITTDNGCDTYTWTANGQVYTQSGTYNYSANCQDYTLNLTITNSTVYYQDQDFDGYGNLNNTLNSCNGAPVGYIAIAGDCNDNNTNINPGASEICGNGIDDNCDGNMDEGCGCFNPPTASAGVDTAICAGNTISLNGTIGGGASNAVWSTSGSGTFVPAANVLNATYIPSANDISSGAVTLTLTTNAIAPCNIAVSSKNVTINPLPLSSGLISGLAEICYPLNNIFTYSIAPVPGATSYTWSVPPGTVIQGSATGTSIQVKFINDNVHASIVGAITVTANNSNGCGSAAPSSLILQVHISAPIQPSTISGPVSACNGSVGIYSVAPVFRAMSYNWTVPTGATIINGAGSNIITVQYGAGFTGGNISVSVTNICGTGAPRTRTITRNVLTAPKSINGPVEGLCNAINATYSIPPVNGANSYNWTLPLGATIISGAGSNAITVEFDNSFTSGSITVAAVNSCGVGLARSITVKAVPGIPSAINGPITSCVNSNKSYSTPPVVGAMSYNWTVPSNAIINSGQGTKNINITYGSLASNTGIITVKAINSCGASSVRVLSVKTTNCPRAGNTSGFIVNLFPNPTSGILNIESNELLKRIELFDMLGKLVMTYGNEKQIDISNLQSGLYLIRFTSEYGVEQRRVEVSR